MCQVADVSKRTNILLLWGSSFIFRSRLEKRNHLFCADFWPWSCKKVKQWPWCTVKTWHSSLLKSASLSWLILPQGLFVLENNIALKSYWIFLITSEKQRRKQDNNPENWPFGVVQYKIAYLGIALHSIGQHSTVQYNIVKRSVVGYITIVS